MTYRTLFAFIILNIIFVTIVNCQSLLDIEGLTVWYSADSVNVTADGYVDTLYDKSGNDYHGVQHSLGQQPKYIETDEKLFNRPSVYFDGNDFILTKFKECLYQPNTFFVIWKEDVTNVATCFTGLSTDICNQLYYNEDLRIYAGIEVKSAFYAPFDYTLFESQFNRSKSSLFINDELYSIGNVGSQGLEGLNIGLHAIGLMGIVGNISEFICFNKLLSLEEKMVVIKYIQKKYTGFVNLGDDIVIPYGFKPTELSAYNDWSTKYLWSTGDRNSNIFVVNSGEYSVEAYDKFGLVSYDTIKVRYPVVFQPDKQIKLCAGEHYVWDPHLVGNYFYSWSTGSTQSVLDITTSGNYWLKVTDDEGYMWYSDTISVFVDSITEMSIFDKTNTECCIGDHLTSLIMGNYDYLWTTGDTITSIIVSQAGRYGLTISSKMGCGSITDEISVAIKGDLPIPQFISQYYCEGDDTELISTSYTTDNTQIERTTWYVEQDTLLGVSQKHRFNTSTQHLVTLEVENENGCIGTFVDTITIHPNPVARFSPKFSCQYTKNEFVSSSVLAEGKIVAYQWQAGEEIGNDSIFLFGSDEVGTFPISLKVTSNFGCSSEITDNVEVRSSSKLGFIHSKSCVGDTVLFFDITKYESYNPIVEGCWIFDGRKYAYNEIFSTRLNDTLPHTISLQVNTFNGCLNKVHDTVHAYNIPIVNLMDTVYSCQNDTIKLKNRFSEKDTISSYNWIVNDLKYSEQQPVVIFKQHGVYEYALQVTNEHECINQASGIILVDKNPYSDFSFYPEYGAAPLEVQFTNLSNNAKKYQWVFEDSLMFEDENPTYIFEDKKKSYAQLIAYSKYGCSDTITKYIPIQLSDMKLKITGVDAVVQNGKIQYVVQVLNTGNDNIREIEFSISISDYPQLSETWNGILKPNEILTYDFSVKTMASQSEPPQYLCVTSAISSKNQNSTYYTDEYCKDYTDDFTLYHIAPNPIEKSAILSFATKQRGSVTIECFDENGKKRMAQELRDILEGYHAVLIDCTQLKPGRYVFKVKQGNRSEIISVIKL